MTELELLQALLNKLGELQTVIQGLQTSFDELMPWVEAVQTYLTFAVVVGAGIAVVWFILRPIYQFLR
jgi:hypothetical protein